MENSKIYQLKISLKGITPQIYRTVLVKSDITLKKLNHVIQTVMGWDGYHLYLFDIYGIEYGEKDETGFTEYKSLSAKLEKLIKNEKEKFQYTYDFGDDWEHTIVVEKILPAEEGKKYPVCIKGKRNCPPEDCGGIWGYQDILKQFSAGTLEEDLKEWLGDDFDPEYFDLDEINEMLK